MQKNLKPPEDEEHDLHPTDDGESSEEPHGASDQTQLGLNLDLLVSLDVVKGCRVKVDLHHVKFGLHLLSWKHKACLVFTCLKLLLTKHNQVC